MTARLVDAGAALARPLAKLSPPRLYNALPRERLFDRLDAARTHSALWIQGPPGAGKSTLVASYIAARRLPSIWYHVDDGDRDPATFFYYLGLAATPFSSKSRVELPLLSAEYAANLSGYARRCFQMLFALLPKPAVLVLDNYEDVDAASPLHALMEQAVRQIPDGFNVVLVSRTAPLPLFASLVVKQQVAVIDADELPFTIDETRQVAGPRRPGDDGLLVQVHARMGGWAAGTVLALDRMRRAGYDAHALELDSREAVFDYFAGEVFDRASTEHQSMLLATAFLPSMTVELAQRVSGVDSAARLLKELYRRHLFVERRTSAQHVYRYHALFREFLRERARDKLPAPRLAQLIGDSARALQDGGAIEEALELYLQAEDWPSAVALLRLQAPGWLRQGRGQTLRGHIDRLPAQAGDADAWLGFWYAASLVGSDPSEAMRRLVAARARFEHSGDVLGRMAAAAASIEACLYEFSDFTQLDPWIATLDETIESCPVFPSPAYELRVYTAAVMAAVARQPGHPLLRARVEHMWLLLRGASDVNEKVNAAQWMLAVAGLAGSFDDVPRAVALVAPLLDDPQLSPLPRAHWYRQLGYLHYLQGQYELALECLRKGQEISRRHRFPAALALDLYAITLVAVALGDVESAQDELSAFEAAAGVPVRKAELAVWHHARSLVALYKGDFEASFAAARAAADAAAQTGWPQMETLRRLQLAFMHAEVGNPAAAMAEVQQAEQLIVGTALQFYDCGLLLARAYIALKQDDSAQCEALLRQALGQARASSFVFVTRFLPDALPRLFEHALRAGIEVDYTREVIRRLRILPSPAAGEQWPWPLKLRTLGAFEAWVEDERIAFVRKAQRRPLDLLKALVALGGQDVELDRISNALWPDADGDAARKSLESALYRVRKLMQQDGLIQLREGKLSLDVRRVWVDATQLERELQGDESPAELQRVLVLYRGHFLDNEREEPWLLPMRLKLRNLFFAWLRERGAQLERAGDRKTAEGLYRRGLELDPTEEDLCRRLMRLHRDRGDQAEAMRLYTRCKKALATQLGASPCAETEALCRSLATMVASER